MKLWQRMRFDWLVLRVAIIAYVVVGGLTASTADGQIPENATRPLFGIAVNARVVAQIPEFPGYYGVQSVTPDNAMKMETIGGCDGWFDFAPADHLLAYADEHGFQLHGHTLLWHEQTSWCADLYTKADLEIYVRTVVGHYCGRVPSMDVINEALGKESYYRLPEESVWARLYGDDGYIEDAFRWARDACPEMKLYYNDYGIEWGVKSTRMLALAGRLANQGLIDGVGFQGHFDLHVKYDDFAVVMDEVTALDLEFAISELDVRFGKPYWEVTQEELLEQAEVYRRVAQLCVERPACVRFTVGGIDDGHTWINRHPLFGGIPDAPLLFDRGYQPKPAYCLGIRDVLALPKGDCELDSNR